MCFGSRLLPVRCPPGGPYRHCSGVGRRRPHSPATGRPFFAVHSDGVRRSRRTGGLADHVTCACATMGVRAEGRSCPRRCVGAGQRGHGAHSLARPCTRWCGVMLGRATPSARPPVRIPDRSRATRTPCGIPGSDTTKVRKGAGMCRRLPCNTGTVPSERGPASCSAPCVFMSVWRVRTFPPRDLSVPVFAHSGRRKPVGEARLHTATYHPQAHGVCVAPRALVEVLGRRVDHFFTQQGARRPLGHPGPGAAPWCSTAGRQTYSLTLRLCVLLWLHCGGHLAAGPQPAGDACVACVCLRPHAAACLPAVCRVWCSRRCDTGLASFACAVIAGRHRCQRALAVAYHLSLVPCHLGVQAACRLPVWMPSIRTHRLVVPVLVHLVW